MNIGFIGLGKLGFPCSLAIESKGHKIYAYDVNPKIKEYIDSKYYPHIEKSIKKYINKTKINILKSNIEVLDNSDIVFISVQTPHNKKYEGISRIPNTKSDFDYKFLIKTIENISSYKKNKIIVIISTVLPGTLEKYIIPILPKNIKLCYNPYFIAMGTVIDDFLNPEFTLLGCSDIKVSNFVEKFYKTIHSKKVFKTSIKNAELIKVSYNTFIGMKIVFANTIMEICHKTGCNCDEVINALSLARNRLISSKYLYGGMGDGGGCHPRDNIAMSWLANKLKLSHNFFNDIMIARENQTEWLVNIFLKFNGNKYVLGKSFKKNSNLITGSPAILFSNILKEKNVSFIHYDPLIDDNKPLFKKGIYFIASNHDIFKKFNFPHGSIVIDPWGIIKQSGVKVVSIGRLNTSKHITIPVFTSK
jgi:UDPglucose 6-dehydrogenase